MAEPVDSHNAAALADQFLRQLYTRIAAMLHPHHREHEPGGIDPVQIPLGFIKDMTITNPVVGQMIGCIAANDAGGSWGNVAGGGGAGTPHGIHLYLSLPATIIPLGPCNVSGSAYTITSIRFASDGEVSGSCTPGGSFSFAAGGGVDRTDSLSVAWTDDTVMAVTIDEPQGVDGTWLTIDIAFE